MVKTPEYLKSVILEHINDWSTSQIAKHTGYSNRRVREVKQEIRESSLSDDVEINISLDNNKLRQTIQALRDQIRILKKSDRTTHRYMNATEVYAKELVAALEKRSLLTAPLTKSHDIVHNECTGIVQLSDPHFNELIYLPNNVYDFKEAARRLKMQIHKSIYVCKLYEVENVIFAMTGDMINSDRRLDELLNMATNRSRATMLAVHLISQAILELNQYFNVEVIYVSGNESRVQDHMAYSDILISDNYDTMVFEILKRDFKHSNGIKFLKTRIVEAVVEDVQEHNILFMHGGQIGDTGIDKKIQQIKGKFNIPIHYIIYGHLHDARIGDLYARSSSMCGANAYSDHALQLEGRASQLLHLVRRSGIDCIKLDLQNTSGWVGYDIDEELEYYHAKSADKVAILRGKTI